MGTKVDIDRNLWRAAVTKEGIRIGKAVAAAKALSHGHEFDDRAYSKYWPSEKDRFEKAQGTGKDVATDKADLKKMGYQVTSTNDKKGIGIRLEKDCLAMQLVNGDDSYEVQIDLDDAGEGKNVDVAANM